jgi:small-conductance mechanosensitive channel
MLFDWLRKYLYFDKDPDAGGGGQKDDQKTDDSAGGEDAEKAGKKKEKVADITFTAEQQALVDQKIGEARTKEREKAKGELEAETAKAKKKADEEALKDKQEWQKLAEQRQTEIDDLTKAKTELEPFKDQAEKYKKALDSILAAQKKELPKHIVELLEKMDPVEAMDYITKHAKDLGVKPSTYSETPDGKEKKVSDDDKKEAQKAADTVITRVF